MRLTSEELKEQYSILEKHLDIDVHEFVDMLAVESEEFVTNLCKIIVRDEKLNKLGI